MRYVPLAILLCLTACASAPRLPPSRPFSAPNELVRTSQAMAAVIGALSLTDGDLTADEQKEAMLARAAALRAMGEFVYDTLSMDDQLTVDQMVRAALDAVRKRRKQQIADEGAVGARQ